ncbi:hypothetical protein ARMSODRAFT_1056523 [Armillaria solidipes]|uniref:Uncharacterized protein n=1 Tax=Armillaria solidipes TaxID=1076256 RepID=A0A2H3BAJ3_9AGAR|nr:hypothetical protein ARMSODRAFT_1056523 [Armillaria solidipes]
MYWEQEGQYPLILGAVIDISMKEQENRKTYNTALDSEGCRTTWWFTTRRMEETELAVRLLALNLGNKDGYVRMSRTYEVDSMAASEVDIPDTSQRRWRPPDIALSLSETKDDVLLLHGQLRPQTTYFMAIAGVSSIFKLFSLQLEDPEMQTAKELRIEGRGCWHASIIHTTKEVSRHTSKSIQNKLTGKFFANKDKAPFQ